MLSELILLYVSRWSSKHMCIHACWSKREVTQCLTEQKLCLHCLAHGGLVAVVPTLKGSIAEL